MADQWVRDCEQAKDLANETLALIQERNLKHPDVGSEASRLTASARRKLGTLGSLLDQLRNAVESPELSGLSENERNRRRDLVASLRSRREQMLQALKRDAAPRADRGALLGGGSGSGGAARAGGGGSGAARETDATAELSNEGLLQQQTTIMVRQDQELESLERTVVGTKHIALQINEEADLHNRLLGDLDEEVDATSSRLQAAQRRLKLVMRKSGSCKATLLIVLLLVILVVVIIIGFKVAIHF